MDIGIFGVTGNPPHLGHWNVIENASKQVDEVWISPVFNHAFGKKFLDYNIRVNMIEAMLMDKPIKNAYLKHLDKEYYEKYHDIVYSYNLLKYLKEKYPENNFKLIIGNDNFNSEVWSKFYKHQEILDEFGVVVIEEQGLHSTDIRNKLQKNEVIVKSVTESVLKIIMSNNLYKE